MPKKPSLPMRKMMLIVSNLDENHKSIRDLSKQIGVAKSTLHDNLPNYRSKIKQYESWAKNPSLVIIKKVLQLVMVGRLALSAPSTIAGDQES